LVHIISVSSNTDLLEKEENYHCY